LWSNRPRQLSIDIQRSEFTVPGKPTRSCLKVPKTAAGDVVNPDEENNRPGAPTNINIRLQTQTVEHKLVQPNVEMWNKTNPRT
jgi:hypothetical protein